MAAVIQDRLRATDSKTYRVQWNADERPQLRSVLPALRIFEGTCALNNFLIAIETSTAFNRLPPVNTLTEFWTPWDTFLHESKKIHLVTADLEFFQAVIDTNPQVALNLRPVGGNPEMDCESEVTLNYIPSTDMMYHMTVMAQTIREMTSDMAVLRTQLRQLQFRVGAVVEALAYVNADVAIQFGLNIPNHPHRGPEGGRNRH